MQIPEHLTHSHTFDAGSQAAERGTRWVLAITVVMMSLEIAAGLGFGSMALLADGWHMGSHAVAVGLSVLAYWAARRFAADTRFAFGSWKLEVLAGYTSAVLLAVIAALMAIGSVERLLQPQAIQYPEATAIAVLGLVVNGVCAFILGHAHHHGRGQEPGHHGAHGHAPHEHVGHDGHHHDLNLQSAYLHVLADAATSVLAIVALLGGWAYGWDWLDPVMGLAGSVLVAWWARGLIAETGRVLLDREMDHPVVQEIREAVESDGGLTRVTDLHVWRVGRSAYACALTAVTRDAGLTAQDLRRRVSVHEEVVHSTFEVHRLEA